MGTEISTGGRHHGRTLAAAALGMLPLWAAAQAPAAASAPAAAATAFNGGDTAWLLISTVLVTLMVVPGIAVFYAGLVRRKNALATVALVLGSSAVVTLVWFGVGYSLAFSPGTGWIGGLDNVLLERASSATAVHPLAPTVPEPVFVMFQLAFAMVTVGLIFGAVVERVRFGAAMTFAALWSLLVYAPVAHWVWHPSGWLHGFGHLDYAGGTVVHLASGVAALVLAGVVGERKGYGVEPMPPHNLMLTTLGAGLLWVGWFGFNGGSAFAASGDAARAVLVTQAAAAAGLLGWWLLEWVTRGQVSLLGLASGLVAGLIAITPASGFVGLGPALVIGLAGSMCCFFAATWLKGKLGYDDSLDVFGLHGVAGLLGTLLTGVFHAGSRSPWEQLGVQAVGAAVVMAYVALVTWVLAWILRSVMSLRVRERSEQEGLDIAQHGESLAG
jgi:ammonium transporter, Amt family